MTNLKFPTVIDSWCNDSLFCSEGFWSEWAGIVEIDTLQFAVGGASVKIWSPNYNYYVSAVFQCYAQSVYLFDATRSNTILHFLIALEKDKMRGTCWLNLFDVNGKVAIKNFSVNTLGVWESKDMAMNELSADVGFDWAHVTKISFGADQIGGGYPPEGGAFWIDQLYFSYDVPDSSLIITSNLLGKNGTYTDDLYGSQQFTTPSELIRPVGQLGTIQIDVVNFDHWEDDPQNINPTRQFTFPSTNSTLTAIYTIQANPLLVIDSFDQNMKTVSGTSAVKLVYAGIPQFVNVPFAARVNKGLFSFTAQDTAERVFNHWILPDKSSSVDKTITWDIQADTRVEVHWQVTENGGGGNNNILIMGATAILVVGGFAFLMMRRKK